MRVTTNFNFHGEISMKASSDLSYCGMKAASGLYCYCEVSMSGHTWPSQLRCGQYERPYLTSATTARIPHILWSSAAMMQLVNELCLLFILY
jgi:hypothetical protein